MRIAASIGTEAIGSPLPPRTLVEQGRSAERDGFPSAWCVHFSRGVDALTILGVVGTQTRHIELGVGVVPTYPRHPLALAQQAATAQALAGGRLTLGVGVSHRPVIEGMHGIPYEKPAHHMREYLSILGPLLTEGKASFQGERYHVDAQITVPGTHRVSIVVGGLSSRMVQIAGELADGVVTWLAGRRTLENQIVPRVRRAAAEADRPPPRVIAALPVAVCDDTEEARGVANQALSRYAALTNYQRQFEREGVATPGDVAVLASESVVEQALRALADIGVTEFWPITIPVGEDAQDSLRRTRALLTALAPEI